MSDALPAALDQVSDAEVDRVVAHMKSVGTFSTLMSNHLDEVATGDLLAECVARLGEERVQRFLAKKSGRAA